MTTHDTEDFFGPVKTPEEIAKEIFASKERAHAVEKPSVWAPVIEGGPPAATPVAETPVAPVAEVVVAEAEIEVPTRSVLVEEHGTDMPEDPAPGWFPQDEPVADLDREAVDEMPESVVARNEASALDTVSEAPPLAEALLRPDVQLPVDAVFTLHSAEDVAPATPPVLEEQVALFNGYDTDPEVVKSVTPPLGAASRLPDPALVVDASFLLTMHDVAPLSVDGAPLPDNEAVGLSEELLERLSVTEDVTPRDPLVIDGVTVLFNGDAVASNGASSNGAHALVADDEPLAVATELSSGELPELSELSEAAEAFFQEPVGSFSEEPIGRHAKKLDEAQSPEETARKFIAQGGFFDDEPQRRLFGRRRNRD